MTCADDAVLIAENKEDLPQLLDITEEESRRKGYELKCNKKEVIVVVSQINECAWINSLSAKINGTNVNSKRYVDNTTLLPTATKTFRKSLV